MSNLSNVPNGLKDLISDEIEGFYLLYLSYVIPSDPSHAVHKIQLPYYAYVDSNGVIYSSVNLSDLVNYYRMFLDNVKLSLSDDQCSIPRYALLEIIKFNNLDYISLSL